MNNYKEAIQKLHDLIDLKPEPLLDIFREYHPDFNKSSKGYDFRTLVLAFCYDQAAINLVKALLPKARYGFDFNPSIQPDKNGREKTAQGWVKWKTIDWSISHKYPSVAVLIALLHVLNSIEIEKERVTADKLPSNM